MEDTTPSADERPLVLLGQPLFPEFAAALAGRFRFVLVADADAATLAQGRALLIGLNPVTDDHLAALPALGLVAGISVGVNHVDLAACRRRGIAVTNAGAAFAVDTADYGVGLVVAVLRRVSGKRVGIVGLGNIGSRIARRLAAFGCAVSYNSRSPKPSAPYEFVPAVRDLAAGSDVLVLSCALTEETRHVVNGEVMEALGKDGVLVNVGRGGLVDEPELVRCLQEGVIGGAGLDVFESERAVATPESIRGTIELVAANLDAFFAGKPLLSPVEL
uniref:Glyoxylate reductase n=1 Tax=Aegilops tauschii subsp. strangulata TaxID=200361 RepID=A0A453AAT7_AEGTS